MSLPTPYYDHAGITIYHGDCRGILPGLAPVDLVLTDPPYGLEFMGKDWDRGVPGVRLWGAVRDAAKPGAPLLAFGGTRTHHRLMCAIEDAGWEIRDCLMWLYGSGFPKSRDISKSIDMHGGKAIAWFGPWFRAWRQEQGITQKEVAALFPSKTGALTGCVANWELGLNMPTADQFNTIRDEYGLPFSSLAEAERDVVGENPRKAGWYTARDGHDITAPATDAAKLWDGWGTALKPAWEPIVLAMKPCAGTFAENALKHGVAGLNVDGGRIGVGSPVPGGGGTLQAWRAAEGRTDLPPGYCGPTEGHSEGRWPANLILDEEAGAMLDEQASDVGGGHHPKARGKGGLATSGHAGQSHLSEKSDGLGGASRFFYCAKASRAERGAGNNHPTVKPLALMRYLLKLLSTPTGGVVLDPFMGSGSTLVAARDMGNPAIGIDLNEADCATAVKRLGQKLFDFGQPEEKGRESDGPT